MPMQGIYVITSPLNRMKPEEFVQRPVGPEGGIYFGIASPYLTDKIGGAEYNKVRDWLRRFVVAGGQKTPYVPFIGMRPDLLSYGSKRAPADWEPYAKHFARVTPQETIDRIMHLAKHDWRFHFITPIPRAYWYKINWWCKDTTSKTDQKIAKILTPIADPTPSLSRAMYEHLLEWKFSLQSDTDVLLGDVVALGNKRVYYTSWSSGERRVEAFRYHLMGPTDDGEDHSYMYRGGPFVRPNVGKRYDTHQQDLAELLLDSGGFGKVVWQENPSGQPNNSRDAWLRPSTYARTENGGGNEIYRQNVIML